MDRVARVVGLLVACSAAACFVDIPADEPVPSSCTARTCSEHAYCNDGDCFCDPNYVGNPDALHGCQPVGALSPCETTCGLNAYCDAGSCRCAEGFVAVCGTGDCTATASLCDGTVDCANAADEDVRVCFDGEVQQWSIVDDCDDGRGIAWRLFSQDRDWIWPGPDDTFASAGLGVSASESIECLVGELVCFGGAAGDRSWGVGLDGRAECEDCCQPCSATSVELEPLTCS